LFNAAGLTTTFAQPVVVSSPAIQAQYLAANCANCHGTNGVSQAATLPSLAGMPAPLMLSHLSQFKSGARPATLMPQIVKGYTDDQLALIATYFAQQPSQAKTANPLKGGQ
jgi:cytochrome c553